MDSGPLKLVLRYFSEFRKVALLFRKVAKVLNCCGTGTSVKNNLVLNPELRSTSKWWGESDVDRE